MNYTEEEEKTLAKYKQPVRETHIIKCITKNLKNRLIGFTKKIFANIHIPKIIYIPINQPSKSKSLNASERKYSDKPPMPIFTL
jgi:hypothetical protein